ncbi:unnamed protein product [Leptosia nina]|uniref:Uncharacterized protein n=1 Tax=Leptosia nina TaxID=320188 RepID=A0AAV1K3I3_9NEOP
MTSVMQSSSANSSPASSRLDSSDDMAIVLVKKYVKDLLRSRIFLGRYLERRLVDQRIGYRDVVLVSAAETELKKDLLEAVRRLRLVYPNLHWIGVTDSSTLGLNVSSGMCMWTEIDNQPFGPFWFQIKSIKFREHEILLTLNCVRHITDAFIELEPILTGAVKPKKVEDSQVEVKASNDESFSDIKETLKSALSIRNVKEFVTFIVALVIAVFTGSIAFVNFLGNFILALLREFSLLIKNSTPMLLGFLDFLSKIVGGFYILLAMLFKPSNPGPQNKRSVAYFDNGNRYNGRDFD